MDGKFEDIKYFPRKVKEKKKKSFLRRLITRLAILAVAFFVLAIIILNAVTPIIVKTAEAKLKSMSVAAVNNAVFDVMTTSVSYNDLITITTDQSGNIRLISANTQLINRLAQETSRAATAYLSKIQGIGITVGTMTGIAALMGKGPEIIIQAVPSGSVICEFMSEFEEAGINQTHHKIYLEVLCLVVLILPANRIEIYNKVQVLISENIIVGAVPETFVRVGTLGGTAYDLIPK